MMEYRTVIAEDSSELDECVNMLIGEGWKPFGGVGVAAAFRDPLLNAECVYVQVIVRQKPKPAIKTFVDGVGWETEE